MSFDVKEWKNAILDYLQLKVKNSEFGDLENFVREYKKLSIDIQKILEYACKYAKEPQKDRICKIYADFTLDIAGEMAESLYKKGLDLNKDKSCEELVDAISKQAYRILEKTRYGQREEVFYILTRIFLVYEKEFPPELARAFSPIWTNELFKIFIYSFLNGVLAKSY